ncbi:hypothetical protein EYR38_010667 [Pleurotus pulmonarius]|nr:hypothetical protein EYR38_010667 [Pleurotus pulmonarius]
MPSASTNKHTSQVNGDTVNRTTGSDRKAGNDAKGLESICKVCLDVFRKTWDEFYEWERGYCEAKLAALMDERRKGARVKTTTAVTAEVASPSSPPTPVITTLSSNDMLDLSDAFADFDADPIYESCTPLHGNVYVRDDPDVMPFLPFGEEDWDGYPLPGGGRRHFSYEVYIKEYSKLAWISEFDNPDLDCILYATTQRLISMSISYEQMDATGAFAGVSGLPLLSASPGGHLGLEARAARRVFPPFPGLPSALTPRPPAPSVLSTFKTHIYLLFCHNLTCIRDICPTHFEDTFYPHATTPTKKSAQLADDGQTQEPCSPACFLLSIPGHRGITGATEQPPPSLDSWSETERETLVILLELDADARPCDLAVIMKKSCSEIFGFRKHMFTDATFLSRNPRKASLRPPKRRVRDTVTLEYTGEAILESTCLSRDHIIAHRERNYLFDLNTTLRVDSSLAGDPSRFINHGDTPNLVDGDEGAGEGFANVSSYVEIANGGHGVMLYADIDMDAGTELLLDYGPKFFKQVHDDGENEEENEEEPKEGEVILRYKGYGYDDPEYGEAEEYRE